MWTRWLTFSLTLGLAGAATAATFPINLGGPYVWFSQELLPGNRSSLYAYNNTDYDVSYVIVYLNDATSFQLGSDARISPLSGYDPGSDYLEVGGLFPDEPLLSSHSGILLGTIDASSQLTPFEEGAIWDMSPTPFGPKPFAGQTWGFFPCDEPNCPPVYGVYVPKQTPEPAFLWLVAVALVVTHGVRGGKILRRKASVGAPT